MKRLMPMGLSMTMNIGDSQTLVQVLFAFGWDDVLRSVAWVVDGQVMRRILNADGTTFDRWSTSPTLTEEWRMESIYCFFRPALVSSVDHATVLLGSHVDVLDNVPTGPLVAPRHRALDR